MKSKLKYLLLGIGLYSIINNSHSTTTNMKIGNGDPIVKIDIMNKFQNKRYKLKDLIPEIDKCKENKYPKFG